MTIEELKDSGAIYFDKITEGMQQYDNQIVRMNEYHQAVDKFTELWKPAAVKMYMWISTILRFHRRQENRSTVFLPIRNENMFIRWNIRKGRYCSRQTRFCSPSAPD